VEITANRGVACSKKAEGKDRVRGQQGKPFRLASKDRGEGKGGKGEVKKGERDIRLRKKGGLVLKAALT